MPYPAPILDRLGSIYEELMWLARRPYVNPRQARAWYSQVMARTFLNVRIFTGMVSTSALADPSGRLVLEHYDRLSFELSRLIEMHVELNLTDPAAFVALIERCERVNITTDEENHRVQRTRGDYAAAHIQLVPWVSADLAARQILWKSKLRGRVVNAGEFGPEGVA